MNKEYTILFANEIRYTGKDGIELITDDTLDCEMYRVVILYQGKIIDCLTGKEIYELPLTYDGYIDNGIYSDTTYYTNLYSFNPSDEKDQKLFDGIAKDGLNMYLNEQELIKSKKLILIDKRKKIY